MIRVFLIVSILLVSGCATQGNLDSASISTGIQRLDASVEYLSEDRKTLPSTHFPKHVVLVFPYIPGEIFGTPKSEALFQVNLGNKQDFSLDLHGSVEKIDKAAMPLSEKWIEKGLSISQAGTRLARIGTFPFNAVTAKPIGGGGFIEETTKDSLILVYVNKACKVTGTLTINGESYRHDIDFPGPGYHFISVRNVGDGSYLLKQRPSSEGVKFSIHISSLQSA